MSDSDEEGFSIHKASIIINVTRPDYKPIRIKKDQNKIQLKETKIQEIIKECSAAYTNTKSHGFCCKVVPKLVVFIEKTTINDSIAKRFKELLGILAFTNTDTFGCNLLTIAILTSMFQEAKKQDFQAFYRRTDLTELIKAVNTSIEKNKKNLLEKPFSSILESIITELKELSTPKSKDKH